MFSSDPVVLGYCRSTSSARRSLEFSFYDDSQNTGQFKYDLSQATLIQSYSGARQILVYRRHKRSSMRFYCFNFSELDILPSQESEGSDAQSTCANESLAADCTRVGSPTNLEGAVFDTEVLSQVRKPSHVIDSAI